MSFLQGFFTAANHIVNTIGYWIYNVLYLMATNWKYTAGALFAVLIIYIIFFKDKK